MSNRKPNLETSTRPFLFHLGPFRFESEIDIPELGDSSGSDRIAVTLSLGVVPASLPGASSYWSWQIAPNEYLLDIPGVARYSIRNGSEVTIDIVPGAPAGDLSGYLLGSVVGALCHQNGLLPLHASAVEFRGAVTAFVADSGSGKSTLAACLQQRGHRIVSDDICLLQPEDDAMRVLPIAGWLKLWRESFEHIGETPAEQHRIFSGYDKYRLFLPGSGPASMHLARLPLANIVFLGKAPDTQDQPTLTRVPAPEAIAALMDKTYMIYAARLAGHQVRLFQQCARAFSHAQAHRLMVPWGLDRMDSTLDLLERDIFR